MKKLMKIVGAFALAQTAMASAAKLFDFTGAGCSFAGADCSTPQSYGEPALVNASGAAINSTNGAVTKAV